MAPFDDLRLVVHFGRFSSYPAKICANQTAGMGEIDFVRYTHPCESASIPHYISDIEHKMQVMQYDSDSPGLLPHDDTTKFITPIKSSGN